ncbi:MAG: phosphomethylpyrimidine synthase [Coxiella sp. DG_40]|nr:MAG: phosphomethylpyrimidine synthase [Coxiella sp. DG_40]
MTTQVQLARKNIITREMEQVAEYEGIDAEWIRNKVATGRVVIPKNLNREFTPRGIGNGLKTKINANIGTSQEHCNLSDELDKLHVAVKYGADAVMDLSTGGDLDIIRKHIIEQSNVAVGTVPIYAVMTKIITTGKNISAMQPNELFLEIENQAEMGVDFVTLHCGVTRASLAFLENHPRLGGIVSRGGALLKRWMQDNNAENPLYEQYDRVLDICERYDVTISLGDGLRPGAGNDATDRGQIAELLILGELVKRAQQRGVQVIVEGPGHVPLDQIEMNIKLMKKICHHAPFYVLGPLTTDIAAGYDHISGAIGGAIAAANGADFLCYVTPAEHLTLPDLNDVKQGVIASKIAAHSGDIVKGIRGAKERDHAISKARRELDWDNIYKYALDPELARKRRKASASATQKHCTMCGNLCAIKIDRDILD